MALNIATIVPALEKAKNIATEAYTDISTSTGVAEAITTSQGYTDSSTSQGVAQAITTSQGYTNQHTSGMLTDVNFDTNITTIDGGKITTGNLFSKDINFTGRITGGSGGLGGIIQSANYIDGVSGMKIDLVNGSMYIA